MPDIFSLSRRDLYRLRRTKLAAARAALQAQMAQNNLEELTLELERRYELLGKRASIDIHSGLITGGDIATPRAVAGAIQGGNP